MRHSLTVRRVPAVLASVVAAGLLLAGCADFPDTEAPKTWHGQRELTPEQGPTPQLPGGEGGSSGGGGSTPPDPQRIPPPKGCKDFNPAVIGTCLNEVSAVAALPGSDAQPAGLAGERRSGGIYRVRKDSDPKLLTKLPVDTAGGGGLSGLALSPTYNEDQLIYAYLTTRTDNRVVRFTVGDRPKPVLTGIPRGRTGNRGALALDHSGALLVATGDAGGSPGPGSLAGKVLRIDPSGKPAKGNPRKASPIVAAGLHSPGGVCNSADGATSWVTDRRPDADALYKLDLSGNLGQAAWTWRNGRPGVAGCAAFSDSLMVAGATAGNIQNFALNSDGTFTGAPTPIMAGKAGYGRIEGMDVVADAGAMIGTANKLPGGDPVSSDDRVAIVFPQGGGGGGKD